MNTKYVVIVTFNGDIDHIAEFPSESIFLDNLSFIKEEMPYARFEYLNDYTVLVFA